MKKLLAILMSCALVFAVTSCAKKQSSAAPEEKAKTEVEAVVESVENIATETATEVEATSEAAVEKVEAVAEEATENAEKPAETVPAEPAEN